VSFRVVFVATVLASLAAPVLAGSPPVKSKVTPDSVAASCEALGSRGETLGNGAGCRNTTTGAAVVCSGNQCTDYFADPRYAKIKSILDAGRTKPQKAPI